MPEFVNMTFGARFVLPDKPTIFQVLAYDSARFDDPKMPSFVILWEMAKTVIIEWDCAKFPNYTVELSALEDLSVVKVIEWVGVQASLWRFALDKTPKN